MSLQHLGKRKKEMKLDACTESNGTEKRKIKLTRSRKGKQISTGLRVGLFFLKALAKNRQSQVKPTEHFLKKGKFHL